MDHDYPGRTRSTVYDKAFILRENGARLRHVRLAAAFGMLFLAASAFAAPERDVEKIVLSFLGVPFFGFFGFLLPPCHRWAERRSMTRKAICACVTALVSAMSMSAAIAGADCDALSGDDATLPGLIVPEAGPAWKRLRLPALGDVDDALSRLDNSDDEPRVYAVDLNADGHDELLLTTENGRLCGNAGCPYLLLDPKSFRQIGEFFGHLTILDERVNAYRIIQSYSRYRTDTSSLDTYVFHGGAYRRVAHVLVDACGLEQWRRGMRGNP